jgi:integration host factor subunit beta
MPVTNLLDAAHTPGANLGYRDRERTRSPRQLPCPSKEVAAMTKSQLIEAVVNRGGLPRKAVENAVNTIFDAFVDALQRGERVEIRGFGNFTIREYRSYTGRNPKTGDKVDVLSKRMPFFKVGNDLRDRINLNGSP